MIDSKDHFGYQSEISKIEEDVQVSQFYDNYNNILGELGDIEFSKKNQMEEEIEGLFEPRQDDKSDLISSKILDFRLDDEHYSWTLIDLLYHT